jgi:hypothetical protein
MFLSMPLIFGIWVGPLEFRVNPLSYFKRDYIKVANDSNKSGMFRLEALEVRKGKITNKPVSAVRFSHKELWLPPNRMRKVFFSFSPNKVPLNKLAICATHLEPSAPVQLRVCSIVSILP